ncbi:uncharacterized protein LOC128239478 [Mya arenaria]|uniref:uncharacterized protein LOC128239478 n=1 Tax=Mya arenaria TaxID=6604 RepID=UPI0022E1D4EC|nr:uncharacterized protein LOC128239478 [Mya arenaria]
MEPGRVFQIDVPPRQQQFGSLGQQSSNVYYDIHEDAMEQYHYICAQNAPDHYDEINVTQYDRDTEIVPSDELTDDSNSLRNVTDSKSKDELNGSDESISWWRVTQSYSDLHHACKTDNMNGVYTRGSVVESNRSIELVCTKDCMELEEFCQKNKDEDRRKPVATDSEEGE